MDRTQICLNLRGRDSKELFGNRERKKGGGGGLVLVRGDDQHPALYVRHTLYEFGKQFLFF